MSSSTLWLFSKFFIGLVLGHFILPTFEISIFSVKIVVFSLTHSAYACVCIYLLKGARLNCFAATVLNISFLATDFS